MPEEDLPRPGGVVVAPVLVGVDGSPDCLPAVRHAAAEATRLGAPLRIVHVAPDHPLLSALLPGGQSRVDEVARTALGRAIDVATATSEQPVDAEVISGSTVGELCRSAQHARLLVVGSSPHPRRGRVGAGSTVLGLAARSPVPLVCVPSSWGSEPTRDRVVVGLKGPGSGTSLLDRAFAVAAERGATLEIVHAWRLPGEYDDLLDSPERLEQWRRHTLDELDPIVEEGRQRHPQVAAELRICHDQAADALVEASSRADLVMIERPVHTLAGVHLGSTARGVLRESVSPVEITADISPSTNTSPRSHH